MYFVAHDLQRPKQITGASQMQEKHRGAAVSRHAFSIILPILGYRGVWVIGRGIRVGGFSAEAFN